MVPRDRRIPKEFWDPRNRPGYASKTPFQQVKECLIYKHKVLDFLRAPMDAAGIANMERQLEWIRQNAEEIRYPTERCTLEIVKATCVRFVISEFESDGMSVDGYCRDVIIEGWGNFGAHGSYSPENLFMFVVGTRTTSI